MTHKEKRQTIMTAAGLMNRIENEYPYIIQWLNDEHDRFNNVVDSLHIIKRLIVPNCNNTREIFDRMGIERSKWQTLYRVCYNWIKDNEDLVQLRML